MINISKKIDEMDMDWMESVKLREMIIDAIIKEGKRHLDYVKYCNNEMMKYRALYFKEKKKND